MTTPIFLPLGFARLLATTSVFLAALLLCGKALPQHAQRTLLDSVHVHPAYHGQVPKKSDVIFSSRFKRDNAAAVAKAFGATRIEWVYSTDPSFFQSLRSVAPWIGGTVNSSMPLPQDGGVAKDLDGNPIVAPWMKFWGAKWTTTTDSRTRSVIEGVARQYLDLGASSIQVDDPLMQYAAGILGGDFSESSLNGFSKFLSAYPNQNELKRLGIAVGEHFDYKKFLSEKYGINNSVDYKNRYRSLPTTYLWFAYLKGSVVSYFASFRSFLNTAHGKTVPLSMNLLLTGPDESNPKFQLANFADYAMVETKIDDLEAVSLQAATYRAIGMGYAPSILPLTKSENRAAIAMLYAMGAQPLVPWDVFINKDPEEKPSRFFGSPQDYADLFRFVARNAVYFDNYEEVAVAGIVVPVDKYKSQQTLALVRRLSKAQVPYALVLLGGIKERHMVDQARLSRFRLLLSPNPLSDFSNDDLLALRDLPVRLLTDRELTDHAIESMTPFFGNYTGSMRLFLRSLPQTTDIVVLHVIRKKSENRNGQDNRCENTVGLKRDVISPYWLTAATWHSLARTQNIKIVESGMGSSFQLPDCEEWGVLELSIQPSKPAPDGL
jgi:hypothetical protein